MAANFRVDEVGILSGWSILLSMYGDGVLFSPMEVGILSGCSILLKR